LELTAYIIRHQIARGISFDFISADGYYGNDAGFAQSIESLGYLYMLDIHSDKTIYLERPELLIPEPKSLKGAKPKRLKATTEDISASEYLRTLDSSQWQKLKMRNTAKDVLTCEYHFARVFIWNKVMNQVEPRMLVIRRTKSGKDTIEI
jgi:SRSO17 transposase